MATWADIEYQFGGMLITMLGANAAPAAAMFSALTSSVAQLAALEAAAASVLGAASREYELFGVVMREATRAATHRHRFAHWCWAFCDELSDALLFVNPEALMEHDMNRGGVEAPFDGHGLLGDLDRSRVLVYRERDLMEAIEELDEASYCVSHLRFMIALKSRAPSEMLAQRYLSLITRPGVAQALIRLRARRKSDPSAHPSRRRKGRTTE